MNYIKDYMKLQRLVYKSGFISFGYRVFGGWEHVDPINPDMNDPIVKATNVKNNQKR